ncbi:hypothetical protein Patl1_20976 [Pistacia atlantica]|uniref:Uncharacterized protein n=1 Tax=Pistacia atlantica TaxID=434234 RepID=A0ACC1BMP0_9ROSI|nr:hypothetical protein Patl1_20976 [Pistacia atlantica]
MSSPDGCVFPIENAAKAVDNNGTVTGINCKDEIVMGVEMLIASKSSNRRIHSVHRHFGMVLSRSCLDLIFCSLIFLLVISMFSLTFLCFICIFLACEIDRE